MKHINKNKIELEWSFTLTKQKLQIFYEIENLSGEDIYILDMMFHLTGKPILNSQLAYTLIKGDQLEFFRGILAIPENLFVEVPDLPFARLLRTGEKKQGIIDPPLPLIFHHPYKWNDHEELRTTHHIRLRIGYLVANKLNPQPIMKLVDGIEVYYPKYQEVVNVQHFLETSIQKGKVDILVKP